MSHDSDNVDHRSAIVITIEGLGARWLEPWGCGSVRTPAFNRLAAGGLLIENAHAIHGDPVQQWKQWVQSGRGGEPDWLTKLADSGRTVILMTDSPPIASAAEPHFQEVVELEPVRAETAADDLFKTHFVTFFAAAAELVRTLPEQGTLLWIHSAGFHLPWDAPWEMRMDAKGDEDPDPPTEMIPPDFLGETDDPDSNDLVTGWQQAMAAQVHVLDSALALFLESVLDPESCSNMPLVCLASTGGYGMGEHGRIGPARPGLFFDEFIHVPFLCSFPGNEIGHFRLSGLMTSDRLSRVLDGWMNGEPANGILDLSIFPDRSRRLIYEKTGQTQMIRTSTWKLLRAGGERQLFLKPDDRWDQNDVASLCRDVADQLDALLEQMPDPSGDGLAPDRTPLTELLTRRVE